IELRLANTSLQEILPRAIEAARPLIDAQEHALTVELPPEPMPLYADPIRLAQVITNLLTNAARYCEPGGTIIVSAEREGPHIVLCVRDSGIGIAPELIPEVFDMFRQADQGLARVHGGLGIGLTLVKSLVEMHGGQVEVKSEGLGKGS